MFCPNCGKEIKGPAAFCGFCGARLEEAVPPMPSGPRPDAGQPPREETLPAEIVRCCDGKYRWMYEVPLWKGNPIFTSVCKVFLLVFFCILVPGLFLTGLSRGFAEALISTLSFLVPGLAGMFLLLFIGYALTALISGGTYCAVFTMDEEQITHAQTKKQADRGRILAALRMLSGDPADALMLLSTEKFTTRYEDVKKITYDPKGNRIVLDSGMVKNQIYADREEAAFVLAYLRPRCGHAVIRGG